MEDWYHAKMEASRRGSQEKINKSGCQILFVKSLKPHQSEWDLYQRLFSDIRVKLGNCAWKSMSGQNQTAWCGYVKLRLSIDN